ncbi:MAG: hypothetical protein PQJ46_09370 [Spirochaetales bacterium]|nr:hypothetical protein [Spirochaetales bacterium]
MAYFKAEDIKSKITAIENAIDTVLTGGKSYRLNDGQGDIQVTRESLSSLQSALDYWIEKYNELDTSADIVSIRSYR